MRISLSLRNLCIGRAWIHPNTYKRNQSKPGDEYLRSDKCDSALLSDKSPTHVTVQLVTRSLLRAVRRNFNDLEDICLVSAHYLSKVYIDIITQSTHKHKRRSWVSNLTYEGGWCELYLAVQDCR